MATCACKCACDCGCNAISLGKQESVDLQAALKQLPCKTSDWDIAFCLGVAITKLCGKNTLLQEEVQLLSGQPVGCRAAPEVEDASVQGVLKSLPCHEADQDTLFCLGGAVAKLCAKNRMLQEDVKLLHDQTARCGAEVGLGEPKQQTQGLQDDKSTSPTHEGKNAPARKVVKHDVLHGMTDAVLLTQVGFKDVRGHTKQLRTETLLHAGSSCKHRIKQQIPNAFIKQPDKTVRSPKPQRYQHQQVVSMPRHGGLVSRPTQQHAATSRPTGSNRIFAAPPAYRRVGSWQP
eukprot:TRINITY_DN35709_c0_g1_i1.p1 TRINITY_DN35709_c0_g1~~TRINITY_DN35709_c0_g1_i1.p1  ORF type:complete len:290 (+),score=52.51 TRINITY_DN35709_c0_g1_i1:53-922(+)